MMSNMGPFGNNKSSPWARGGVGNAPGGMVGQGGPLQQQMLNQGAGMVQYQQGQVFQSPMGLQSQNMGMGLQQLTSPSVGLNPGMGQQLNPTQLFPQVGAVTYPNPRALNQAAFQTNLTSVNPVQSQQNNSTKQRVFTGTVTKVHDNFGFVDEDVFFQTTACVKGSNPQVGDRVLVEASFNPNMPFKWNATRIQVLPTSGQNVTPNRQMQNTKNYNTQSGYNAVPPPMENSNGNYMSSRNTPKSNKIGARRDRSRDHDRDDDEIERKRRREERTREREEKDKKSPLRRRSRSPKARRRARIVPRYMVQIPKIALHLPSADVLELRRRYTNLYVPSDFFSSQFRWIDAFPPNNPFALNKPCQFHIMNKDVDPVGENDAVLEPSDADYLFSAKVMLMSVPNMEEIFTKCCSITDDKERKERDSEERDFVHPTRLINFLVGLRGKNETMAIGGPWSPSLDGENPDKDPSVLIKTAIRTCKALTGIDLSNCTQWYRFVELYYRRAESSHRGKTIPARVETIVIYLPDVWTCLPTRLEWDQTHQIYKKQLERKLHHATSEEQSNIDDSINDDKEDENTTENKIEPTHYSQLDPKVMSIVALRNELKARNINSKGLKSQLIARLTKILKTESEKSGEENLEAEQNDSKMEEEKTDSEKKILEEKKLDEKEKQMLEKKYNLPEEQHVIVHPSRVAKSGKFDCTVMSLSLLLDYRPEDTKEHSFEVSLFAELFNEMLMRDFGFNIYKAIHCQPEKVEEKKDDKKRKDEKDKDKVEKLDKTSEKVEKTDKKPVEEEPCEEIDDNDDKKDTRSEKSKSSDKEKDSRKKEKRIKMITKDKDLLLSFVYFDTTHCGYIFEKDIEELIFTLGLSLSRAQVRKLVSKVVTRDSLHYRKLTDGPKDEIEACEKEEKLENNVNVEELAFGNKRLLPIFKNQPTNTDNEKMEEGLQPSDGFVMYQGALMDVGKLITQLSRSEKARLDTEQRMIELKKDNTRLSEKNEKSSTTIKNLTSDLSDCKKKLQSSDDAFVKVTSSSKLFYTTLLEIKDKIEPVIALNNKKEKEEDVKKENSHESRWEADEKERIKKEIKTETIEKENTIVIQE